MSKSTMEAISAPGSKLGELIDPIASEAAVVTGTDPRSKLPVKRGYRLKLTRKEVVAIQAEGHRIVREENAQNLAQGGYQHTWPNLGSLFDHNFLQQIAPQHIRHPFIPNTSPAARSGTGAGKGATTISQAMINADYSQIEKRLLAFYDTQGSASRRAIKEEINRYAEQVRQQMLQDMMAPMSDRYYLDLETRDTRESDNRCIFRGIDPYVSRPSSPFRNSKDGA